jgi:hypothetical protein
VKLTTVVSFTQLDGIKKVEQGDTPNDNPKTSCVQLAILVSWTQQFNIIIEGEYGFMWQI